MAKLATGAITAPPKDEPANVIPIASPRLAPNQLDMTRAAGNRVAALRPTPIIRYAISKTGNEFARLASRHAQADIAVPATMRRRASTRSSSRPIKGPLIPADTARRLCKPETLVRLHPKYLIS